MIFLIALVLIALIGVPLFAVIGGSGMLLFLDRPEGTPAGVAFDVFGGTFAASPALLTIPLFTLAGYVLAAGQTRGRWLELTRTWLGWLPADFAASCLTGAARSVVPLMLYGIVALLVFHHLVLAAVFPGLLLAVALAISGAIAGARTRVEREPFVIAAAWRALWIAKWEVALPIVVIAGMALDLVTIGEAAALSALYALFIEVVIYKEIALARDFPRIATDAMCAVGVIVLLTTGAFAFDAWLIQAGLPTALLDWMDGAASSRIAFLLTVNLLAVLAGMLDTVAAIVVVAALLAPLSSHRVDPYQLAIIALLDLAIGALLPTLGIGPFAARPAGESTSQARRLAIPMLCALLLTLAVVNCAPAMTTYLRDQGRAAQ